MSTEQAQQPVVEVRGLRKSYGPIDAVAGVDLTIAPGEFVALVGDNGAGKSTVAKMISGAVTPDAGTIVVNGRPVSFSSPADAIGVGINTVYQDLALVPNLDVVSNLFLGRERTRNWGPLRLISQRDMKRDAQKFLSSLEVNVPRITGQVAGTMSGGQQQAVAIARAAFWSASLLILDEPTAALGLRESQAVLRLVDRLRKEGVAVLMISHILPHIMDLADRIVVLRHGRLVADIDAHHARIDMDHLVGLIVGTVTEAAVAP